jgi:DNA-binding transcriptional LysR family regulator
MAKCAIEGIGLTVLPDDQACPELTRLFALPPEISSDIWLLMHPELRDCRRLQVFKNHLIEAFRSEETFKLYGLFD